MAEEPERSGDAEGSFGVAVRAGMEPRSDRIQRRNKTNMHLNMPTEKKNVEVVLEKKHKKVYKLGTTRWLRTTASLIYKTHLASPQGGWEYCTASCRDQ